jgi:hypothetical protein
VGNNPDPVSSVGCSDGTSWYNNRLDFVSFGFEVLADALKGEPAFLSIKVVRLEKVGRATHVSRLAGLHHRCDSSNIFTNDPSGVNLSDCPMHLLPEVAVVFLSLSSTCEAERLAGEASCENIDFAPPFCKVGFCNVFITLCVWKPII